MRPISSHPLQSFIRLVQLYSGHHCTVKKIKQYLRSIKHTEKHEERLTIRMSMLLQNEIQIPLGRQKTNVNEFEAHIHALLGTCQHRLNVSWAYPQVIQRITQNYYLIKMQNSLMCDVIKQ